MKREKEITINTIVEEIMSRYHFFSEEAHADIRNGAGNFNLSSSFTAMIKEAAKCNRFSSDLIYDIQAINDRLNHFNTESEECFKPIVIACRKDGVDGNLFVLSRVIEASRNCAYAICFPQDYFAVFAVTFEKGNLWDLKIKVVGSYV